MGTETMSSPVINAGETILLIGDTGDGKTAQIGELAEHLKSTTGLPSRIYTADTGRAWMTVKPHVDLGIIEVVELLPSDDPHVWLNAAVNAQVRDGNKWVPGKPVAMNVFEGFTSIGAALMGHIQRQAASGAHKAGEERFVLQTGAGKIASNNRTDYNLIQGRLRDFSQQSMILNSVVVWTAALNRAQDEGMTTVLGPQLVGNALTAYVPMWFQYTFRVAAIPQAGQAPRHVLYIEDHLDQQAGMAKGLGNARVPLAGEATKVPFSIEPASIVKALTLLKERQEAAKAEIAKRVGITVTK
jgi:energy-coupling factor transporter ATP-binding protein EcfA2